MKNKIIALALVGVMLSVCFAGVFSYVDDADAIDGNGGMGNPYLLNAANKPMELSELKNSAIVYFNLAFDTTYGTVAKIDTKVVVKGDPATAYESGEVFEKLTVTKPGIGDGKEYRYSSEISVSTENLIDAECMVFYVVTINYGTTPTPTAPTTIEYVYYMAYVKIISPADDDTVFITLKGNVHYNGDWTVSGSNSGNNRYVGNETSESINALFEGDGHYYSSNILPGLYLKEVKGGTTIVGMLGSSVTKSGSFDVYKVTEEDVTKITVDYDVFAADSGNGFKYAVNGDTEVVPDTTSNTTIIVKTGTTLTITTDVDLTQCKVTNSTNDTYKLVDDTDDTVNKGKYEIASNVSGTVKVFMTYNNGINDNCTKVLTIIYIGSTADASLSNPVVRSY